MVSNVNPTDPKFIDGDDLDTEGHRRYDNIDGVSPTEQDTTGLRNAPTDEEGDTEGHRISADVAEGEGFKAMADKPEGIMSRAEEDDTEGHLKSL